MLAQIGVKRLRTGFSEQRLEHHVLAVAFGETFAVFLSQGSDPCIAVLFFNSAAFVAVAAIQSTTSPCQNGFFRSTPARLVHVRSLRPQERTFQNRRDCRGSGDIPIGLIARQILLTAARSEMSQHKDADCR